MLLVLEMELQCNSALKLKYREVSGKADKKLGQYLRELLPSFLELSSMFRLDHVPFWECISV